MGHKIKLALRDLNFLFIFFSRFSGPGAQIEKSKYSLKKHINLLILNDTLYSR